MALYYLDTSAAFKLLAAEEHADAFLAFHREHRGDNWIRLRIEVSRAVARNWPALIPDAQRLVDAFEHVQVDEDVVRSAIVEPDRLLRSLERSTWQQRGCSARNLPPCSHMTNGSPKPPLTPGYLSLHHAMPERAQRRVSHP